LLERAGKKFVRARAAAKEAARSQLEAINLLREAGLDYQQASGHEQGTFAFFELVRPQLPTEMTFGAVKICVHLANKYDGPITDLKEANREVQEMFVALGEMERPRRLEAQKPHEHNPWNDFASGVASLTGLFEKLEVQVMSTWEREKLETFVRETEPIVQQHEAAKRLIEKPQ